MAESPPTDLAPPGASAATERLDPQVILLGLVIVSGTVMAILDTTIVNVALQTLGKDFHASLSTIQWTITGYTLALGTVIPITGWAVDRFGGRRVWMLSIVLFAFVHTGNGGETAMGIIAVSLAGLAFVFSLWWTGSLWWAIGFHAAWDWAQSYLYGVADSGLISEGHLLASRPTGTALISGGTTGPEGSVLVVPVLLATLVVIWRTMPRRSPPILDGKA